MIWRSLHDRLLGVGCAVSLCVALLATVAGADPPRPSHCGWGPVTDVEAVRNLLHEWVLSTKLPPFEDDRWDASIDRSNVWVRLQFASGTLRVAWQLDDDCAPTAIAVEPSAAYDGIVPDEEAVKQLVASFRAVTIEQRFKTHEYTHPPGRWTSILFVAASLVVLGALLAWVFQPAARRWRATGRVPAADVIRVLGMVAIVVLLPYEVLDGGRGGARDWAAVNSIILIGVLPLMAFLWLAVAGAFGYGSPRREDWPVLLAFLLALAVREGYARHGIEELEIYFYYGEFPNRHSVVHALYQMFVQSLGTDPYRLMMHVNGILGALATLPLFLFVRQRTDSRMAAGLVAALYAVHPVIVQMTPTDGHYALLLATWFAGLAVLTADDVDARRLFGGVALLVIAATSRSEGSLYLVASLFLVDLKPLLATARRHMGVAAVLACAVLGLIALQMSYVLPAHTAAGESMPRIGPVTATNVLRAGLYSEDFNDPLFVKLVLVGALAGLLNRRLRIGLGAALGTLIVVWPMSMATTEGFTVLHRLVPVCALQVIAAGVGTAWITSWLPSALRHRWVAAIPGVILVLFLFAAHRHEMRAPNAVTDEFWMLRNHLAPEGVVNQHCALMFVGSTMDTDIHDFAQVLPGMDMIRCERDDCVRAASQDGCFYYLRSLNCYFSESVISTDCFDRGRTPAGDLMPCLRPRCADLEEALELSPLEEKTVDVYAAFRGDPRWPRWPRSADIGLYKVLGVRAPTPPPPPP
jgi:hypothetical protein